MKNHSSYSHESITWRAPEFVYKKKTLIWYTHVSVFFFLALVLLFLVKNYWGVGIVSLLFLAFIVKAEEKPRIITYKIDKSGLTLDDQTISFSEIHSFIYDQVGKTPVIVCDLNYPFSLPVTIVAKEDTSDEILDILAEHVPMRNDFSLIRWITHRLYY